MILLNFINFLCVPCRRETPDLVNLYNTYHERGLEVVQTLYQDEDGSPADTDDLNRWIQEFSIPYIMFSDMDYSTLRTYEVIYFPHNLLIDRDFIIRYIPSEFDLGAFVQKIEELL